MKNGTDALSAGQLAPVPWTDPITGRSEFVCLRNCLLPDGASPSAIRRLIPVVADPPMGGGRDLQISLMRNEPGSHAHQDCAQSFGLSGPFGVGVRHAPNMEHDRWPSLRTQLRVKPAE